MKINEISKSAFWEFCYNNSQEFLDKINKPEIFIVKEMYEPEVIINFRNKVYQNGISTPASWHPLHDDCPDYHRLHDNYPNAYVKQKMHAFYFHSWKKENNSIFDNFSEIYHIKNKLAGYDKNEFRHNIPKDGIITRLNVHHYPRGGGYQAEHIDPVGSHAQIQTLIMASKFGVDYKNGGVFGRSEIGSEKIFIDPYTDIGDMIVMSPGIPHGVAPIDSENEYNWQTNNGRWVILPIFVKSDYEQSANIKPKQIN